MMPGGRGSKVMPVRPANGGWAPGAGCSAPTPAPPPPPHCTLYMQLYNGDVTDRDKPLWALLSNDFW